MGQLFGSKWTAQHGETPSTIWVNDLQTLTKAQLHNGVQVMKELGQDFPPSLPAFMSYCTKGKPINQIDHVARPNFDQGKFIPPGYNKPALAGHVMTAEEARAEAKRIVGLNPNHEDAA